MPLTNIQKVNLQLEVIGSMAAGGASVKPTANVLHYIRGNLSTTYVPSAFLTAWLAACKANWKAFCSSSWTLQKVRVRCVDSADEGYTESVVAEAGSIAGDCLPNNAAGVISKKTALRGKFYQGRVYIPAVPESGNVNNALTNAQKLLLDAIATDLSGTIVDANAISYVPSVLSPTKSTGLTLSPAILVVNTPITSMRAHQIIGSMNSRKAKVND